nr:right-handed parallel beta-helix repeat-containing protein [uncultured Pedobacter sp.]
MKLRYQSMLLILTAVSVITIYACKKEEVTTFTKIELPTSSPLQPGNIGGFVKGTLQADQTYYITSDLTIKKGDTLSAQPGAKIIVKNNAQVTVQGVLNLIGSKDQPIFFNSDTDKPGTWGGFQCDTAQAVTIKWTHVDNTGGPDAGGSARGTLKVNAPIKVDIEDSWFTNGQDDMFAISNGAKVTILRNTISSSGSTDGECMNLKSGVTGAVAYNVVFSQAGSGVKLETSTTVPFPQTEVDVYNNTFVSIGWRRGAAEPGRAVSVGVNAIGHIYNNIIVNCFHGIELFSDGDIAHTTYGNNLFYATVDEFADLGDPTLKVNIRDGFYPNSGVGVPQSSDLISKAVGNLDPLFVNFDGTVAAPNGFPNTYDFSLKNGSPAFGTGNVNFRNNLGNQDIGAYTLDNKGNKH